MVKRIINAICTWAGQDGSRGGGTANAAGEATVAATPTAVGDDIQAAVGNLRSALRKLGLLVENGIRGPRDEDREP